VLQLNIALSPRRSRESSKRPFTDAVYRPVASIAELKSRNLDDAQQTQCPAGELGMNRTEALGGIDPKVD
jgi:hypothetical protein